jgi:regulator of replication initiation timing
MINRILNRPSRKELRAEIDRLQKRLHSTEGSVLTISKEWEKSDYKLRSKIKNLELALRDSELECQRLGTHNLNIVNKCNDEFSKNYKKLEAIYNEGFDKMVKEKNEQIVKVQTELSLVQTEYESFKKGAMKQIIDLKKDVNFWSTENEKFFKSNAELKAKLEKFEAAKKKRDEKNAEFMRNKRAQNPNYGRSNKK